MRPPLAWAFNALCRLVVAWRLVVRLLAAVTIGAAPGLLMRPRKHGTFLR